MKFVVFWCRSTTSEQMVADLKRDPHTPFSMLKRGTLNLIHYGRYVKTTTYTSKRTNLIYFGQQ